MKHIFIVNPQAGGHDISQIIAAQLKSVGAEAEVYVTQGPRDATRYVRERLAGEEMSTRGEGVRFYACGGDGTLNEVVSGVMHSTESPNSELRTPNLIEVGCYPCGSGNDYVKNWPRADFLDLEALMEAPSQEVDVMRVGDRYCVNVMNYGFEAEVCRTVERVRHWPLLGGHGSYVVGVVHCLLTKRHNPCRILVDGELWREGDILLGSAANGRYVGGGFMCAPRAEVGDGWLEAQCVDTLSVPRFLSMIGYYKKGEHLERPSMAEVVHYRRGRRVAFAADREFNMVIDGELLSGHRFEAEVLPKALRFIVPAPQNN